MPKLSRIFLLISLRNQDHPLPKVAILGDLYVQDNDAFNQQLINNLESYRAEVVTVPINFAVRLMTVKDNQALLNERRYLSFLQKKILIEAAEMFEARYHQIANVILNEHLPSFNEADLTMLNKYNLSLKHEGETAQNMLKVFSLLKHFPDITLFVHVNPIFCCAGLVSEAIFKAIEKDIGIPIGSIIYDGTTTEKNEMLAPYMHYITQSFSDIRKQVNPRSAFGT